jgi:hypothetical protein
MLARVEFQYNVLKTNEDFKSMNPKWQKYIFPVTFIPALINKGLSEPKIVNRIPHTNHTYT